MELACEDFVAVNVPTTFEQPEDVHEYFSLQAPPNTSIWRKPSASDDTTAPMVLKRLRQSFVLAEVTVSAALSMEFDQAGIVIFAGSLPDPTLSPLAIAARRAPRYSRPGSEPSATGRWAKAGLQLVEGELHAASVVAISPCGADWTSSARLPLPSTPFGPYSVTSQSLRVKLERVGESLWIWYKLTEHLELSQQYPYPDPYLQQRSPEDIASGWKKMREIMGFFNGPPEQQKATFGSGAMRVGPWNLSPDIAGRRHRVWWRSSRIWIFYDLQRLEMFCEAIKKSAIWDEINTMSMPERPSHKLTEATAMQPLSRTSALQVSRSCWHISMTGNDSEI